ncbi:uncharacterized protein LOC143889713 [Tasmannia lanceolata]|uniref:uncharacterized protein LOC143889713 n=1 Tax=Tasmannia lanceolata TaxID=3420 RepID=UPI004064B78C
MVGEVKGGSDGESIESEGFFKSSRGLRQGDPLFVVVAETLSRSLNKGGEKGLLKGFFVGDRNVEISHLQFADDTLLFSSPEILKIANLKATLRCYEAITEAITGQRSNFYKSKVFGINMHQEKVLGFAGILGYSVDFLPSSPPPWSGKTLKGMLDHIVGRVERRLDTWKRNLVSKGGRITLIKVVLANIPIYHLSLAKCHVSAALRLEKIQRRFLWGGSNEKKVISLLSWKKVCKSIKAGGLGIRRIRETNQALLGKWLWRFGEEGSQLWVKVIESKYGSSAGRWESVDNYKKKSATIWRDVMKLKLKFGKGIRFRVYKGNQIRFWLNAWCDYRPLSDIFSDLFLVAADKDALVRDYFIRSENGVVRAPLFRRDFFDRELELVDRLLLFWKRSTSRVLAWIKESGSGTQGGFLG